MLITKDLNREVNWSELNVMCSAAACIASETKQEV